MNKLKNKIKLTYFINLFFLLFLSSCAKYEGKKLPAPHAPIHNKKNIKVSRKALTQKESRKYFSGRNLLARGYQPVQIYIENNTDKTYYLNPNLITLPLESASSVARSMQRNVGWKITKYFIIGGPVWAAIEGVASHDANKMIKSDMGEKSIRLNTAVKIRPHGIINKVMFVAKENYNSDFDVSLIEHKTNKRIKFKL